MPYTSLKLMVPSAPIALLFICQSCYNDVGENDYSLYDKVFNPLEWRRDSTGCLKYRENNFKSLIKNEGFFLGKSKKFLVNFLGHPTLTYQEAPSKVSIFYATECTKLPTPRPDLEARGFAPQNVSYSASEVAKLVFYLENDKCVRIGRVIP